MCIECYHHMHALQDADVDFCCCKDVAVPADGAHLQGTKSTSKQIQPMDGK